jgi:hypothetical protein
MIGTSARAAWFASAALGFISPASMSGQGTFTPGTREILALSFATAQPGQIPAGVRLVSGRVDVVDKDGVRMLRATGPAEFVVTLPEPLPTDFTLEFDLVAKPDGGSDDLAFEGTARRSLNPAISAEVKWSPTTQTVSGGGLNEFSAATPASLSETLPGQLARIIASFAGTTLKLYTNGVRLYTLIDRLFVRGTVLRVTLGGQDEEHAVYLARLRVAAGAGSVIAAAPLVALPAQQTGTITPMAPPPPPPPDISQRPGSLQVVGNGPAPTGLTISGTPTTATLRWNAVTGAVGYQVLRAETGGASSAVLTASPITATSLADVPPDRARTYTYHVRALQADGTYGVAKADFLAPPPEDPTTFTSISPRPGVVQLSWRSVSGVKAYLVSGPGIPSGTQLNGESFTVSAVSPGNHLYRIASVYEPGGVLTAASSWPSTTAPVSSISMLTLPNGPGSLAEYNRHACNTGKWIATQQLWANTWCDLPTATSVANVSALPWLSLFGIQEFQPQQGSDFITGAPFDIYAPATEWTLFSTWKWAREDRIVPEASFEDVSDLGFGRRIGCVARGTGASAATLCWAMSSPRAALSVIIQTAQETSFLVFKESVDQKETRCPWPSKSWESRVCGHLLGVPSTQLDSQGDRYVPHACLSCHGGQFDPATGKVTGASLLPLDPRGFTWVNTYGRTGQEETIRQMNLAIFTAPVSAGVREYITNMYRARQTVVGASVDDAFVPAGWVDQPGLYRDTYRPYCALCHSAQSGPLGFRSWADLLREKARVKRAVCGYTMPHSELPLQRFWTEGGAGSRPGALLAALGYSSCDQP